MSNLEMKPIPEYEDRYFVTKCGRVFSKIGGRLKERKLWTNENGYFTIALYKNGKKYGTGVHRLVYLAWKNSDIPDGMQIAHLDGNPANNHLDNLDCLTPQENIDHKKLHGTHGKALTKKDVKEIRKRYIDEDISQRDLAKDYGVSITTISEIVNYKTWSHLCPELKKDCLSVGRRNEKLTKKEVKEIRKRYIDEDISQTALAKDYDVSIATINRIVNYKSWAHI